MHFIISISCRTAFFLSSVINRNFQNIFITNCSPSFVRVHSLTFANPPSPIISPNTQLTISCAVCLIDGNLIVPTVFFLIISPVSWLVDNLKKVLLRSSLFIAFSKLIYRVYNNHHMSFILERVSSQERLNASVEEVSRPSEVFKFKSNIIVNAKKQSEVEWKSLIFKGLLTFMNILSILCTILRGKAESNEQKQVFDSLCSFFTLSGVMFYILASYNFQHLQNHINHVKDEIGWNYVIKICLLGSFFILHPNQLTEGLFFNFNNKTYEVNSLLCIFVNFRIINIIFFLIQVSRFYGLRVSRVLQIYAVKDKISFGYAIKCLFKQNGLKTPFFMLLTWLILIPFIEISWMNATGQQSDFLLTLYDMVITMTTNGYGDVQHSSYTRFGMLFVIILGSFTSSVLTLTILNFFKLSEQQSKAFATLKRLNINHQIEQQQIRVIRQLMKGKDIKINDKQNYFKNLIGPKINKSKHILQQVGMNQSLMQFYHKNYRALDVQIKKLVQKQLLSSNLINFYIARRRKQRQETELDMEVMSSKSNWSRHSKKKDRKEDSKKYGQFQELILKND